MDSRLPRHYSSVARPCVCTIAVHKNVHQVCVAWRGRAGTAALHVQGQSWTATFLLSKNIQQNLLEERERFLKEINDLKLKIHSLEDTKPPFDPASTSLSKALDEKAQALDEERWAFQAQCEKQRIDISREREALEQESKAFREELDRKIFNEERKALKRAEPVELLPLSSCQNQP